MGGNTPDMALQSHAIPVIITRPEPQATRFAHDLNQSFGIRVYPIVSPLLQLSFTGAHPTGRQFGALILTSEMGALSARRLKDNGVLLPELAYCVGDRTAQVAQLNGFLPVSANGDAGDLVALLLENKKNAPFLHLRGREARGDIVKLLQKQNVEALDLVTYIQEPLSLTEEAAIALSGQGQVFVPLFSPRTARIWTEEISRATISTKLRHFALSPAVAAELTSVPGLQVDIAERPTQECIRHMMSQALIGA